MTDDLVIVRTPLRLSLGGGGTDLPLYATRFGGDTVTATISLYVTIVARVGRLDGLHRYSYEESELAERPADFRHAYMREALALADLREPCEISSMGPVPAGTGLGSSGAFTVGLLAALHALAGRRPAPTELAEQAHHLEAVRLGMPVGPQDQYACAVGGLRRLVIDASGHVDVQSMEVADDVLAELDRRLLLFYTGQRRHSASQLSLPAEQAALSHRIEQLHRIREIGEQMRTALENGDLETVPKLINEHWSVKRGHGPDSRWDSLLWLARQHGASAGKLVGAGGGGFLLLYVHPPAVAQVIETLTANGLRHVSFRLVNHGTTTTSLATLHEEPGGKHDD